MFGRKQRRIEKERARAQSLVNGIVDSLRDGDEIEVQYHLGVGEGHVTIDADGTEKWMKTYDNASTGTVMRSGNHIDYGTPESRSGLRMGNTYWTTAVSRIRILRRAGDK